MPETIHACLQGCSFCLKLVSNSFQACLFGFKSGDMEGQVRILDVVVGEELCGVACCMGSGVVKLKYSAVQSLNARNKPANKYPFLFLNSTKVESNRVVPARC